MCGSRRPFLIAPWIETQNWLRDPDAVALLEKNHLTPALLLRNLLDSLRSPGTGSDVRLGYMLAINVYDLFSKQSGEWVFDPAKLGFFTELFLEVGRPVVINLRANHFVGEGPLIAELLEDQSSFACLNDGSPVREIYYSNAVFAPTFTLDESVPLNHYRFGGFRRAAAMLSEFDRRHPGIIEAVTLAGELHHFLAELANPSAAGCFEGAQMTDYSPASIRDFRRWLRSRHTDVRRLNERFGTRFASWDEVDAPGTDLRRDSTAPLWMHMDSYADGHLPVFGWAELPANCALQVYLDGAPVGQADYGLSRLDVYEAVDWLADSGVGFRFDIDYRRLSPGPHHIHVVREADSGQRWLIGHRVVFTGQLAGSAEANVNFPGLDDLPAACDDRGSFAWLDHPPESLSLIFNPYAAEWQAFRESQVEALLMKFAQIAVEAGLDPRKLYSHQIMPQFEGSWNRLAFALPPDGLAKDLLTPGIDLYGGTTLYPGIAKFVAGKSYAVPEFHPRMGKLISKDVFRRSLEYHRDLGADFLCPYFMALRRQHGAPTDLVNPLDALLIHPLNPALGSLFFYSALVEFLNRRA